MERPQEGLGLEAENTAQPRVADWETAANSQLTGAQ